MHYALSGSFATRENWINHFIRRTPWLVCRRAGNDGPARGRTRGTPLLDSAGALSTLVCPDAGGIAFWIVHVTAIAAVAVLGIVDAGGVGSESRVGLVGWIGESETTSSASVGQVQEKRWRFHVHVHLYLHGWHSFDTVFPSRCSASGQPQSTLVARHSALRTGPCLLQFLRESVETKQL